MVIFVLGVLLGLIAIVMILVGNKTVTGSYNDEYTLPFRYVGFGLAALAGLMLLFSAMYSQEAGDAVVIKSPGGKILSVDTTSGYGFTAPWNKTTTFDITNQKIEMFSNRGGDGDDGAAISAPVKEGTNVDVSITVGFSQRSSCIKSIVENYRTESAMRERALRPGLRSEVRKATARYSAFEIKQSRGKLETDIAEALTDRWQDDICAEIESIDLGDLKLDATTEEALSHVTERQAGVEQARADLEKAQIDAEVTKTNAQAAQAADQITRCGATVTTETHKINGVDTEVDVVKPVPIEHCQNQLNEQVLLNNYIEALQEIGKDGNLIVVDSDVNSILDTVRSGQ